MLDQSEEEQEGRPWWLYAGGGVLGLAVVGMAVALMSGPKPPPKPQNQVTHITLPPPPPPPKKPAEPEPPKTQEVVKNDPPSKPSKEIENKPTLKAAPKPAGAPLTAAAGAGINAYNLAVGNGGGLIGGGGGDGGGGGGNAKWHAYGGQIQSQIEAALQRDDQTRFGSYVLKLHVWIGATGQITRVQLAAPSGDPTLDQAIERLISSAAVGQPPPADMPQPVNLQVRARAG